MNRDCTTPFLCHFLAVFVLFVALMLATNSWMLDVIVR